ncbi:MAG: peptide-methionine (S)-S-oxide reductase [Myxococcales bacterium]|nr:peptide-methionine (S)-S-oxide reductase [Myxococcales bacterium]
MVASAGSALKRDVPLALRTLAFDGPRSSATFVMGCFWSGQACLAELDGVVDAEPGFQNGREVVRVSYDANATSLERLVREASARGCASAVIAEAVGRDLALPVRSVQASFRSSSADDLHALRHSSWRDVPMTRSQALKVNAVLARGEDPSRWLTARQRFLRGRGGEKGPTVVDPHALRTLLGAPREGLRFLARLLPQSGVDTRISLPLGPRAQM